MDFANVIRELLGKTANDQPLNPFDDVEADDDADVEQEPVRYHDCSTFGDLPPGYAKLTKFGLVFHDPRRCPRRASVQTESTDLSLSMEDGVNTDNVQ